MTQIRVFMTWFFKHAKGCWSPTALRPYACPPHVSWGPCFMLLLALLPCRPCSEHFFLFLLSKEHKWQRSDAPPQFPAFSHSPLQLLLPSPCWAGESPYSQALKQKGLGHLCSSLRLPIFTSKWLPPSNRARSPISHYSSHLGCPSWQVLDLSPASRRAP